MKLPSSFTDYTRALLGVEEYEKLAAALEGEQPVSIRLNEDKLPESSFSLFRSSFRHVPWSTAGYYLDKRLTFTFDPLFHAGCYYVQEASSMFVEQALRRYVGEGPVVMLDLCAAPGGKSTHARSVLPAGSLLVAMFRKDPVAVSEWSGENVEICWQRQRRIVTDIWPCLKSGGILIYSTCTYNTKENEENIRWIRDEFGAEVLPLEISTDWNITGNLLSGEDFPAYSFLPHRTKGEGFFLAVLRKPGVSDGNTWAGQVKSWEKGRKPQGKGAKTPGVSKEQLSALYEWFAVPDNYEFIVNGNNVSAFPKAYLSELSALRSSLRIVQAGVDVAELKGKDWMPAHGLAMSIALNPDAFAHEEIGREQAISYLRKEAVVLSETAPRGIVLLTYKQIPLGFVKNIGNRANNLYPQEWRIRSGYLPEGVLELATITG